MTLFFILALACIPFTLQINNRTRYSSYVSRRIKHNSVEIYEKLFSLENWINSYLSYPNSTLFADLNKCLETYNQLFNVIVVKVKIKDRMYCRSVERLVGQHGPIFLRYDYTFNFLIRFWGWSKEQVVILRIWLTDAYFTWSLLKRFVVKHNYPIRLSHYLSETQKGLGVTTYRSKEGSVNVTHNVFKDNCDGVNASCVHIKSR